MALHRAVNLRRIDTDLPKAEIVGDRAVLLPAAIRPRQILTNLAAAWPKNKGLATQ